MWVWVGIALGVLLVLRERTWARVIKLKGGGVKFFPFKLPNYSPTLWMFSGHFHTIGTTIAEMELDIKYRRQVIQIGDGGYITLDWADVSKNYSKKTPTLLFLHGLTGGSYEGYIKGVIKKVQDDDINLRCVVFNARGCAETNLASGQMYCASYTNDLRKAIETIKKETSNSPIIAAGYSLGSNILVKYLGEEKENCPFIAAISLGNPFDLLCSMRALENRAFYRTVYAKALANNLKRAFLKHRHAFLHSNIDHDLVMRSETVSQFDDSFTCKMFGYETVGDYYSDASSARFISKVRVPLLCVQSLDDPISFKDAIPGDECERNPFVVLLETNRGGHLGWFEGFFKLSRFSTNVVINYCNYILAEHESGTLQEKVEQIMKIRNNSSLSVTKVRSKFLSDSERLDKIQSASLETFDVEFFKSNSSIALVEFYRNPKVEEVKEKGKERNFEFQNQVQEETLKVDSLHQEANEEKIEQTEGKIQLGELTNQSSKFESDVEQTIYEDKQDIEDIQVPDICEEKVTTCNGSVQMVSLQEKFNIKADSKIVESILKEENSSGISMKQVAVFATVSVAAFCAGYFIGKRRSRK